MLAQARYIADFARFVARKDAQEHHDSQALGDRALDSLTDIVLVQDRLGARGLGQGVDAEGLAHGIDRGAELG